MNSKLTLKPKKDVFKFNNENIYKAYNITPILHNYT